MPFGLDFGLGLGLVSKWTLKPGQLGLGFSLGLSGLWLLWCV